MSRINIKDIAQSLNISTATISVALSDKAGVSEKLRKTIKAKAHEMGYIANESARNLVTKQSSKIGVFIYNNKREHSDSYLYSTMLHSVIYEASQKNMSTIVYNEKGEVDSKTIIEKINKEYLRGVIILGVNNNIDDNNDIKKLENYETCSIVIFDFIAHGNINTIKADITDSISKPLNYLKGLNHKKIAIISGCHVEKINLLKVEYIKKYSKNNPNIEIKIYYSDYSPKIASHIISEILSSDWMPDAIFCFSDTIAIATIQKLKQHNIKVPNNISVIGFDDISICQYIGEMGLTSIKQDHIKATKQAINIILNNQFSTHINNKITLITRGTCSAK